MKLDATQAAAIKLSHLIEPGRTVYSTDGHAYRVLSKIAAGGSLSFRLANLQGQPVSTPADFFPIDGTRMHFASILKFAYNKDITKIVNEMIEQAGLPTDPKMDWAKYLTKTYSANLSSITTDPDIQDEVIYRTVVYLLFERKNKNGKKVLENFAEKLKNFDVKTQKKPLAEQVSDYLKGTFLYYAKDHAKHDAIALMRPEEMSMEQPGDEGETYNILDTEEHATGTSAFTDPEASADIKSFIQKFYEYRLTKNKASALKYALLLDIYWKQAQQSQTGDIKISDLTQEWIRRTGLTFDSLKQYRDELGSVIRDFVERHSKDLGNAYGFADLLQHTFPPPKRTQKPKAMPAHASSKQAMNAPQLSPEALDRMSRVQLEGLAQGDCEGDGTENCDCQTCEAREELERLTGKQAAKKPTCPHCGSDDYGLMPTDFETAKCNGCGKNWEHGIVEGINDPKSAAGPDEKAQLEEAVSRFSKELKKFPKGPTGMTPDDVKATPEWQEAKRNYSQAFAKLRAYNSQKRAAEALGQCSCEWSECPLGHQAGGCPNPAAHKLEIYGFKTRYCQPCTDATIEYIRLEQGGGDPDDTVKILSSVQTEQDIHPPADAPYCDGCDRLKANCICEGCTCPENKKNAAEEGGKPTLQKLHGGDSGFTPVAAGEGKYTAPGLRVVLAEDWFIYVTDETTEHMWVYNTEMWYEWGEIPNAFGEDMTQPQPTVEVMIPYAKGHTPEPLMKDDGQQLTLQEFENENAEWTDPGFEKESMIGHDFVDADQQAIRPDITPGDTGRLPHGRTQGSSKWGEKLKKMEARRDPENKEAAELAGRGGDKDDVRGAGDLWREEYYQSGNAPPKIATSVKVLECCGSVTNHHKPDCPKQDKVWNGTLGKLYPSGSAGPKVAGKWKVLLRDTKGHQREQQVSSVDYGSAERAVRKYMKEGEKVVSMTIASKRKTAAPAAAAPAPAAPAAAPAPAPTPSPSANTVVAPPPGTAIALPSQQPTDDKPMRKTVPPELPGKKWHMTSKTASILEDAFAYFMEGKKDGGLADVFDERYTRTGRGEDKYIACSKLMMDFEYAFRREEDGSLSDIDDYREDAENALREIVGDDPNYSESAAPAAKEVLKSGQNTPEVEAEVAQLAQTHPLTEVHENCNPAYEHDQWWIICSPCGASWAVEDATGGQSYNGLDLEEVDAGDGSCQENLHESSTLDVPSSLATQAQKVTEASVEKEADGARLTNISSHDLDHDSDGHCKRCGMSMQEASKKPCTGASTEKKAWTDEDEEEETSIPERLEYLRGELRAERISQGELMELQGLADYIDPGDVELLEAAGVEEVIPQPDVPIETPEFDEADKTRLKGLGVIGKKKKAFEPDANSGIRGSNDGTYIYQAEMWCPTCAKEIAADIQQNYPQQMPADPTDEHSYDSDDYPKGPFFDEESDAPEHCAGCHIFLENPLTTHGQEYMQGMVDEALAKGRGEEPHIKEWMDFYEYHPEQVEPEEEHEASAADPVIDPKKAPQKPKEQDAAMDNKKAGISQPTSGEDEGLNVKVTYTPRGITLSPTNNLKNDLLDVHDTVNKPSIWDLMEDFFTNGWEMVNPEDIGALTSGEIMADQDGNVYWHERGQIEDMVEMLMNGEEVRLDYGGNLFEVGQCGWESGVWPFADAEAWPMHHAIAKALGGTVRAFDQYQGPYVLVGSVRLWIQSAEGADGAELRVYNEDNEKLSEPFWWEDTNAAVDAAMSVLDQPAEPAVRGKKQPAKRKGSEEKQAAPGDGGLQRDVQNQYENHPVVQMLWDSLKRDPQHKDRVQTAWGTKTKQGLVLSVARAMKESPVSGE